VSAESGEQGHSKKHQSAADEHEQGEVSSLPYENTREEGVERERDDERKQSKTCFQWRKLEDNLVVERQEEVTSDEHEAVEARDRHRGSGTDRAEDAHRDQGRFRDFRLVPDEDCKCCNSDDQWSQC